MDGQTTVGDVKGMFSAIAAFAASPLRHLPGFHDPFSALSHLAGAVMFVFLGRTLVGRGGPDPIRRALLGVYAFSCVLLFSMSGVYHMTRLGGVAREVMMRLDHGAIFILIAGTFTPVHGLLFRGPLRWGPLAFIWTAALSGVVLKTAFMNSVAEWVGLTLYLVLGWFGAVSGILLWRARGFAFIRALLLGGIAYSVGAAADFLQRPTIVPGVVQAHEIFHVAVLIGAALHYQFIRQFAPPCPAPKP